MPFIRSIQPSEEWSRVRKKNGFADDPTIMNHLPSVILIHIFRRMHVLDLFGFMCLSRHFQFCSKDAMAYFNGSLLVSGYDAAKLVLNEKERDGGFDVVIPMQVFVNHHKLILSHMPNISKIKVGKDHSTYCTWRTKNMTVPKRGILNFLLESCPRLESLECTTSRYVFLDESDCDSKASLLLKRVAIVEGDHSSLPTPTAIFHNLINRSPNLTHLTLCLTKYWETQEETKTMTWTSFVERLPRGLIDLRLGVHWDREPIDLGSIFFSPAMKTLVRLELRGEYQLDSLNGKTFKTPKLKHVNVIFPGQVECYRGIESAVLRDVLRSEFETFLAKNRDSLQDLTVITSSELRDDILETLALLPNLTAVRVSCSKNFSSTAILSFLQNRATAGKAIEAKIGQDWDFEPSMELKATVQRLERHEGCNISFIRFDRTYTRECLCPEDYDNYCWYSDWWRMDEEQEKPNLELHCDNLPNYKEDRASVWSRKNKGRRRNSERHETHLVTMMEGRKRDLKKTRKEKKTFPNFYRKNLEEWKREMDPPIDLCGCEGCLMSSFSAEEKSSLILAGNNISR